MLDATLYPFAAALALTAVAAAWDLRTGLIPNRLVLVGALGAAGMACLAGLSQGAAGVTRSLLVMTVGALVVSPVPVLLFRLGGLGGGDVKLFAVVGALLGPVLGMQVELHAFIVGGLYATVRLAWDGDLRSSLRRLLCMVARPLLPRSRRPAAPEAVAMASFRFGPAIFVGALWVTLRQAGWIT